MEKQSIKAKDFTVVAISDWSYRLFALNWVRHMERLDIDNYLIYCLDESVYEFLKKRNIRCDMFQVSKSKSAEILPDMKTVFKTLSTPTSKATVFDAKMLLFKTVMTTHKNFVYSDLDAIWLKNILPLLAKYIEYYDVVLTGNAFSKFWSPSVLCAFKDSEATQDFIKGWHDEYFSSVEPGKPRNIFHDASCKNFLLKNSNQPEDNGDKYFSHTVGKAEVKVLRKEVITYYSIDNKTFIEMYVYHTTKKQQLLHKTFWRIPWYTTFQYITFAGILYFLWLHIPFLGSSYGSLNPRFAPHRVVRRIARFMFKLVHRDAQPID